MIEYDILGEIGRDNCVSARVMTGTSTDHILFDCGGNCLETVSAKALRETHAVFFSHFHFDHIAGFDQMLRSTWCREGSLVEIFGPPDTCRIIQHKLQGFLWNNASGLPGGYRVSEFDGSSVITRRFLTTEKFAIPHEEPTRIVDGLIYQSENFQVYAIALDHGVPSIGYLVKEPVKQSIDTLRLAVLGLRPGPWTGMLKNSSFSDSERVEIGERNFSLGDLRRELLVTQAGDSLAYLTDFRVDDEGVRQKLVDLFAGVNTMICENNYRSADLELAKKNYHLTSDEVGSLAREILPEELVLFHLSDRYTHAELAEQLEEVRQHFQATTFPCNWSL